MIVFKTLMHFSSFIAVLCSSKPSLKALWNLEKMTECKLHCSALTKYNDYGCWCGPGGSGEPIDEIDKCCMYHDKCYDFAVDKKFCWGVPEEYVDDYTWSCSANGTITCAEENMSECQQHLCWCDKTVVECWGDYPTPTEKMSCKKASIATDIADLSPKLRQIKSVDNSEDENGLFKVFDFLYSAWMFIPTSLFEI